MAAGLGCYCRRMNEPVRTTRERRARARLQVISQLAIFVAIGLASGARAEAPKGPPKEAPKEAPKGPADPLASGPKGPGAPAAPDPLAVLREVDRTWIYEMVQGESLGKLGRAPNMREAPRARCKVVAWVVPGLLAGSRIECELMGAPDGPEGPTWSKHLIFDGVGVRELDDEHDVADRSRTGGLTFPRRLAGTWQLDEKGAGDRRTRVIVREETAPVGGVPQQLWVAETTKWPSANPSLQGPDLEIIRFLPGLGPVLLCTKTDLGNLYHCLRLVEDKPAPPPAPPPQPQPPRVSIASHQAQDPSSLKSAEVAGKVASAYAPAVRRCYEATLAKRPGARGALTLTFTVNAVGKVEGVSATGFDPGLAACVKGAAATWRFPIPMSAYASPRVARFTIGLVLAPP